MFYRCELFNQPLNDWDVSSVEIMEFMFLGCGDFNQPLDDWDVSRVRAMSMMFQGCENFNQDLSDWDVSSVGNECMHEMFNDCRELRYKPDWYDGRIPRDFRH